MKKTIIIVELTFAAFFNLNAQNIAGNKIANEPLEINNAGHISNGVEAGVNTIAETRGNWDNIRLAMSNNMKYDIVSRKWKYVGTTWDKSFSVMAMAGGNFYVLGNQAWGEGPAPADMSNRQLLDTYKRFHVSNNGNLYFSGWQIDMKNSSNGTNGRLVYLPSDKDVIIFNSEAKVASGTVLNSKVSITNQPHWAVPFATNAMLTVDGKVSIGKKAPSGSYANYDLGVDGIIVAKEIFVQNAEWADFVFEEGYELTPLEEVETYIEINKHLPDVPSACEIKEDGLSVGEMQKIQMQKIEELTLYLIDQQKLIEKQSEQIALLAQKLELIEKQ